MVDKLGIYDVLIFNFKNNFMYKVCDRDDEVFFLFGVSIIVYYFCLSYFGFCENYDCIRVIGNYSCRV